MVMLPVSVGQWSEVKGETVIASRPERGALSIEAETGRMFSSVSALPIPSPGWERARVRGIKKADSDNVVSEQEQSDETISQQLLRKGERL